MPSVLLSPVCPGPPGQFIVNGGLLPQPAQTTSYQVAYQGGLEVRAGPFDAPLTGLVLKPNEIFMVDQEVVGMDSRVYLRLADGCGWVFDDTKLMPQDPSVVRCTYTAQATS